MANESLGSIAIVGMSCRFPGGANDPEKLWSLISQGRSAWQDVPSDRFNWKSFYHPSPDINGTMNHRGGHFLDQDISAFDAAFFGIHPAEARAMDPQQRIQLETAYEALENAGLSLEQIRGSSTAVYVATFSRDYDRMMYKDTSDIPKYHMTGAGDAIVSNRISYVLDLKGPSMTLDTGCSGSLVALHQACQSLRTGESSMALVGGTNLILDPDSMISMSLLRILNADGKCYTFDDRGSGYGRGEGVATIVLKRLDDALQAGDTIRAVIRETGVNQDGKTSGITLPSQSAQENLIRSVYSRAGLDPRNVGYVETHGTGTVAGDSTELKSIVNSFCTDRETPLCIGSIKSNIGHLESASGLAGLIKAILVLEKGFIPPNVNLERLKKGLSFDEGKLRIPRVLEPWPPTESGLRYASVNSFGYGGTNAHVIMQAVSVPTGLARLTEAPVSSPNEATRNGTPSDHLRPAMESKRGRHSEDWVATVKGSGNLHTDPSDGMIEKLGVSQLLIMTARSEESLLKMLKDLAKWASCRTMNEDNLCDLSHTLSSRRSMMEWRYSIVASSGQDICSSLSNGAPQMNKASTGISITFVFSGQGAQWFAMGRELIGIQSEFRNSLIMSEQILDNLGAPWRLVEELLRDQSSSRLNESSVAQPATTALQIALVDLLGYLGIQPDIVLGHSSGEIAAAYAARALSRANALSVSFYRGSALEMSKVGKGAMLAVGLGEEDVLRYTSQVRKGRVSIACVNSPFSTTASGDKVAIAELKSLLDSYSIFNKELRVDAAYHSHHMEKVAEQYLTSLHALKVDTISDSVQFISSVTGREKTTDFGPSYWVQNLVSNVRYSAALDTLCQTQLPQTYSGSTMHLLIEVGPHSALVGPTHQTIKHLNRDSFQYHYLPSLVRGQDSLYNMMHLAGKLFEFGYPTRIDSANALGGSRQPRTVVNDLPPYPWDHSTRYWYESRLSKDYRLRQHPYHDLLGLRIVSGRALDHSWRHIINMENLPWLRDHVVENDVIFPGAGYLCMAIEAIRQVVQDRRTVDVIHQFTMRDVVFSKPLMIPESPGRVEAQLSITPRHEVSSIVKGWNGFLVSSISCDGVWSEHCRGAIMVEFEPSVDEVQASREKGLATAAKKEIFHKMREQCTHKVEMKEVYTGLKSNGNGYGPNFAILDDFHTCDLQATAKVVIPHIAATMPSGFMQPHIIHPATLDALFQIALPLFLRHNSFGCVMPTMVKEIVLSANISNEVGKELLAGAEISPDGRRTATIDALAFQLDDHFEMMPVISVSQAELCATGESREATVDSQAGQDTIYQMEWGPDVDFLTTSISKNSGSMVPSEKAGMSLEQKSDNLNRAAAFYVKLCLDRLDEKNWDVSERHMVYMLDWMRHYSRSGPNEKLFADMDSEEIMSLVQKIPKPGVEGEALSRVGDKLSSILAGRIDPLSLLLEDDLLYRLYLHDDSSIQCCAHLAIYLEHLFFKSPYMTILEIGAGTGGTTWPILQSLGKNRRFVRQYDYTDISSGFFASAQSLLHDWSDFVRFKTLDIERDPKDQGFKEASYDLIIASNVLHATEKMDITVANVRKLLKPGGRLALIEVTRLVPFLNVIAGVLPGWWKGIEDGRKDSPLLSVEQWHSLLIRNSFTGIEVAAKDFDSPAGKATMMISSAMGATETTTQQLTIEILLAEKLGDSCRSLSLELSSTLVSRGFPCNSTSMPWQQISDGSIYVILDSSEGPLLVEANVERFTQITSLLTQGKRILWISLQEHLSTEKKSGGGLVTGLARVARSENEMLTFITLDIQQVIGLENRKITQAIVDIISASFGSNAKKESIELEYAYHNDEVLIPRLVPDSRIDSLIRTASERPQVSMGLFHQPRRPLKLHVQKPGLLDSLIFIDDELAKLSPLQPDQLEVQVKACGVNFKDVFVALGRMKASTQMAGECAGVVTAVGSNLQTRFQIGDRVCAWNGTPYASSSRINGSDAYLMPRSLSFTTGASIPVIFLTAYYSLVEIANLQKDQTVLIHVASGGVGQAALMIAQHIGAEIYATAGSDAKRRLIMERYGIAEDHVFSSRSRSFKEGITRLTQGKGIDVILNSLSGVALQDSWHCVAPFGTFVELGKTDIFQRGQIDMEPFDRNVSFASVDMVAVAKFQPHKIHEIFAKMMSMFEDEILVPVQPVTIMAMADVESAFRLIQGRKHNGKIVLEAREDTVVKVLSAKPTPLRLDEAGTYVVAGGLGDIGQNICRLMASHGATHILILSRKTPASDRRRLIESDLASRGAKAYIAACDIGDANSVRKVLRFCQENFPPVKGVIQAAMVLQDRVLEQMTKDDFNIAIQSKFHGTNHLSKAFECSSLDFFIMLSSISSILGVRSQANYAAASAFQDSLAHSKFDSDTHYISLDLGMIDDTEVIASHPERRSNLLREGFIPLRLGQVLSLLEYSMSAQAREDRCKQILIGFDRQSLASQQRFRTLQTPLFCHLPHDGDSGSSEPKARLNKSIDAIIAAAADIDEVHNIVATAMMVHFSTLVALEMDKMSLDSPMKDFGLDSLIAIEMKNWISRTLKAAVQTSEIVDAADLRELVTMVTRRSSLVVAYQPSAAHEGIHGDRQQPELQEAPSSKVSATALTKLDPNPLPNLDDSLDLYLYSIRVFLSDDNEQTTLSAIQDFRQRGGLGQELQDRLSQRAVDPQIDNWLYDLHNAFNYLKVRRPSHMFFGSHLESLFPHSQAERAALVSAAAFRFKQHLDTGELKPDRLNEQPLCMSSLLWIFNSSREPHSDIDQVKSFPGNDYLVALRRGHFYKITVSFEAGSVSYSMLLETFQKILEEDKDITPCVATLTADDRNCWAKIREMVQAVCPSNRMLLETIDAAAFMVCLDDGSPNSPSERANQYLVGDVSTRWSDKVLQFVVCKNGASAFVCNHSMVDGSTMQQLNECVKKAILEHTREVHRNSLRKRINPDSIQVEDYTFKSNPEIENHIRRVERQLHTTTWPREYNHYMCTSFGSDFLLSHRCGPKAGYQLVIQLASLQYFGYLPPCWETISVRTFYKGRADRMQTVLPPVDEFCKAMLDPNVPAKTRLNLFYDAAKTHSNTLTRISRGLGFSNHLDALKEVLRDDEELPLLFCDPTYVDTKPKKIMTSSVLWHDDLQEAGTVAVPDTIPDPELIWVHYEVEHERCRYSIQGPVGRTKDFSDLIEAAARALRKLLEGE